MEDKAEKRYEMEAGWRDLCRSRTSVCQSGRTGNVRRQKQQGHLLLMKTTQWDEYRGGKENGETTRDQGRRSDESDCGLNKWAKDQEEEPRLLYEEKWWMGSLCSSARSVTLKFSDSTGATSHLHWLKNTNTYFFECWGEGGGGG